MTIETDNFSEPYLKLTDVSVDFPVRKHNLGQSSNILSSVNIGGILKRGEGKKNSVSVAGLQNINLEINPGERVGFFGYNGAGKTTILKVMAGVLPPSTGSVRTVGRVTSLLNIGLGVDGELSGYDNLVLRMVYDDIPKDMRDVYIQNVLEFSELGDFFYLPFKTYSSGMRARLLLALSTLRKPDVLIMDEWIGAGDEGFKHKANQRLEEFVSTSGALILATHSRSLLETWTTRGIWLDHGKIRADGPTNEILPEYIAYVKANTG